MSSLVFDSKGKPRRYLSVAQVADMLSVSQRTVERWIAKGKIEGRMPFANWRIPAEEVERLLRQTNIGKPTK